MHAFCSPAESGHPHDPEDQWSSGPLQLCTSAVGMATVPVAVREGEELFGLAEGGNEWSISQAEKRLRERA